MKGFSTILTVLAGLAISPYMVGLTEHFIPSAPSWFPYVVVIIFSGVLYAVGIDALKPISAAIVVGVILFGVGVTWIPQRIDFIGVDVRAPF